MRFGPQRSKAQSLAPPQSFTEINRAKLHRIFVSENIFKVVVKMSIPGMLIAVMSGLYLFVDQILIIRLIPNDGVHNLASNFNGLPDRLLALLNQPDGQAYAPQINALVSGMGTGAIVRRAVNYTTVITAIFGATNLLFSMGTATRYSFYLGKGQVDKARETYAVGMLISFFMPLLIAVVINFARVPWLSYISGSEGGTTSIEADFTTFLQNNGIAAAEVVKAADLAGTIASNWASDFIGVLNWFVVTQAMFTCLQLTLRSEGKTAIPVYISLATNLLNVLLDWVFLGPLKLGIEGGAWATVIGWGVSLIAGFSYWGYLYKKRITLMPLNIFKWLRFDWRIILAIVTVGLASFIRNAAVAVTGTLQNNATVYVAGVEAGGYMSALGAVLPYWALLFPFFIGIVQGARNVSSFNYGAARYDRVKQCHWLAIVMGLAWGLFIYTVVVLGLMRYLVPLFGVQEGTLQFETSMRVAQIWFISAPLAAFTLGGILLYQSTERPLMSILASAMNGIIAYVPIVYIMREAANHDFWIFIWTNPLATAVSAIVIMAMASCTTKWTLGKSKRDKKLHEERTYGKVTV